MVSKKHLLAGNLLSVLEVLIKVAIKNIRASKYRLPLLFHSYCQVHTASKEETTATSIQAAEKKMQIRSL